MIIQLRHTTFITQSLKEIHSGRETGLIDTGPLLNNFIICISCCLKELKINVSIVVFSDHLSSTFCI